MSAATLIEQRGSAAMYLWVPMIAWGVIRLLSALIEWRARIGYERAHAASVVDVVRAVPAGGTVRESRADGTVLCIDIPARPEVRIRGANEITGGKPC
jgi:hypothetical protein